MGNFRLIKAPEDDPAEVAKSVAAYAKYENWIQDFRVKYFNFTQVIDVDATLHPDIIIKNLMSCIDALGYSIYRAPHTKSLPVPEGGLRGKSLSPLHRYSCLII